MAHDDDEDQRLAAEAQAEARRLEIEDIQWLMAGKQGRRLMWRLLAEAGVYRTSFNNSGSVTAFNEGKRQIGLILLGEVNDHAAQQFFVMLKEHNAK